MGRCSGTLSPSHCPDPPRPGTVPPLCPPSSSLEWLSLPAPASGRPRWSSWTPTKKLRGHTDAEIHCRHWFSDFVLWPAWTWAGWPHTCAARGHSSAPWWICSRGPARPDAWSTSPFAQRNSQTGPKLFCWRGCTSSARCCIAPVFGKAEKVIQIDS